MEIYEYRGIRGLVAAKVTKDDSTGYTAGTPFAVAGVASLEKSTATSNAVHYYDNMPAVVIDGAGADTVTINASAIPLDVLADLTGQTYDSTRAMFVEGDVKPQYFAIGYITEDTNGHEIYVWRLKGTFAIPASTHNTKNDGTDAAGQTLTYTGISTTHAFTNNGGKGAKAVNLDATTNPIAEATFFGSVETPDTVTVIPTP